MKTMYPYLYTDQLHHEDMIDLIERLHFSVVYNGEDGVLLKDETFYVLSCATMERAVSLLPKMQDITEGVLHQPFLLDRFPQLAKGLTCHQAAYYSSNPVSYSLPNGYEIRPLDLSHLDFVHAHYAVVQNTDYLAWRIQEGMFGVFFRDEIAGFIGTHGEGTMGMLEILPEHRRKGLAFCLEAHLINRLLAIGRLPVCQIEIHNNASLLLQQKLGLTISDKELTWMNERDEQR